MMNVGRNIKSSIVLILFLICQSGSAQTEKKLYDPSLDGMKQVKEAILKAGSTGKHVLVQYGGNWCPWCIRFNAFCKADAGITKAIEDNYVVVELNYSPENKNDASNIFLGNPTRFGFPVFIIVDGKGRVIHIQDSGLLEAGQGYDQKKVSGFLNNWTATALVPKK
jgi:thiol-disulfide isomerase/thioredoxin